MNIDPCFGHQVEYEAVNFLEKNRDRLATEIISVLRMSQIALVRTLFNSLITKTGRWRPLAFHILKTYIMCIFSSAKQCIYVYIYML